MDLGDDHTFTPRDSAPLIAGMARKAGHPSPVFSVPPGLDLSQNTGPTQPLGSPQGSLGPMLTSSLSYPAILGADSQGCSQPLLHPHSHLAGSGTLKQGPDAPLLVQRVVLWLRHSDT